MPDTSKLEKLNRELEKSEKKLRKAINDEKALQHQLKQLIISWAEMYDSTSMESKKMIVSCLIRRVEVYRDYRLHIDFNIDFEQFSAGLDISAIAA